MEKIKVSNKIQPFLAAYHVLSLSFARLRFQSYQSDFMEISLKLGCLKLRQKKQCLQAVRVILFQ